MAGVISTYAGSFGLALVARMVRVIFVAFVVTSVLFVFNMPPVP